jgi:hypothetical protein
LLTPLEGGSKPKIFTVDTQLTGVTDSKGRHRLTSDLVTREKRLQEYFKSHPTRSEFFRYHHLTTVRKRHYQSVSEVLLSDPLMPAYAPSTDARGDLVRERCQRTYEFVLFAAKKLESEFLIKIPVQEQIDKFSK